MSPTLNTKKNRRGLITLILILLVGAILLSLNVPQTKTQNISLSQLINEAKAGQVTEIDVNGDGVIDHQTAEKALLLLEIDDQGLDPTDRALLNAIITHYKGGPVGIETLSAIASEERTTIEDFIEPYLMQIGFLERTPRGRKVTPKALEYLGHPQLSLRFS